MSLCPSLYVWVWGGYIISFVALQAPCLFSIIPSGQGLQVTLSRCRDDDLLGTCLDVASSLTANPVALTNPSENSNTSNRSRCFSDKVNMIECVVNKTKHTIIATMLLSWKVLYFGGHVFLTFFDPLYAPLHGLGQPSITSTCPTFSASTKRPVDSMTYSTPMSFKRWLTHPPQL